MYNGSTVIVRSIEARIREAKDEREKLEAARLVLTGRQAPSRSPAEGGDEGARDPTVEAARIGADGEWEAVRHPLELSPSATSKSEAFVSN